MANIIVADGQYETFTTNQTLTEVAGKLYYIKNTAVIDIDITYGVSVATLEPGDLGIFMFDGTLWSNLTPAILFTELNPIFDTVVVNETLEANTLESKVATGTAPLIIASTTKVTNLNADQLDGQHAPTGTIVGTSDSQTLTNKVLTSPDINSPDIDGGTVNGITSLTVANNVDIGNFELRAKTLESDVATGTAPLTVASTTKVTNLNADLLDGISSGSFVRDTGTETIGGVKTFSSIPLVPSNPIVDGDAGTVQGNNVYDFTRPRSVIDLNTAKNTNVTTNLSLSNTTTTTTITSSDGTNATIPAVTTLKSGVMTSTDKTNLNTNTSKVTNATHTGDVTGSATLSIGTGKVLNAHIGDNQVNSEHYAAGSIDNEHMASNSINSNQYVDGSIDRIHLANDIIDGTKIANDVINSEHYVAGSIDNEHIADNAVDSEHYANNSIDYQHVNWGTGTNQIYAVHVPTVDQFATTNAANVQDVLDDFDVDINTNNSKVSNVATNLSTTTATTLITINSSDGNNAVIGQATGSIAGLMTTTHHNKLDGIESSANKYILPLATSTGRGGIELYSNTDNPTSANSVTSTAGRTYGIQLNSSNQAVVNVPWASGAVVADAYFSTHVSGSGNTNFNLTALSTGQTGHVAVRTTTGTTSIILPGGGTYSYSFGGGGGSGSAAGVSGGTNVGTLNGSYGSVVYTKIT